jgi:beta-glucan synthesis-associated protein KRE6
MDPIFEAIDQPDFTNNAMQFYDSSYVTTKDGNLVISTRAQKTSWKTFDETTKTSKVNTKNYTSGMVQSWNKFCFTGGILEISVQLPGGRSDAGGLWLVLSHSYVLYNIYFIIL